MLKVFRKCDKTLLFITIVFSILGLLMVFSSSSIISSFNEKITSYHYFIKQLGFVVISYIGGLLVVNIPISKYKKNINLIAIINLLLLIGLFFFAKKINGSRSWYDLKVFNLQPSELSKVIIILFSAFYFQKHQKIATRKTTSFKDSFYIPAIYSLIVAFLVFKQPDFGTTAIIISLVIGIHLILPLNKDMWIKLGKIVAVSILAAFAVYNFRGGIFNEQQLKRFNFKQPCTRYVEDTGYQLCNSFIAINNGGLSGVGLGSSTQKFLYLPAGHTDFIFSIITEELGSIGGVLIIIGYVIMLYRIYRISKNSSNIRNSIIAFGAFIVIFVHVFTNLAGITGLIPLTGIPLPFLSYGGSFTITMYILMFFVQRVAIENYDDNFKKAIKSI